MNRIRRFFNKYISFTFLISVLFVVAMCIVLSYKANYHVDEMFTYGKANYKAPLSYHLDKDTGKLYIPIVDGKVYIPGGKALHDYVVVKPHEGFDYANVWKNEAKDVHPPFYSVLVHTICSFFPGEFSVWFAASINIVFAVLSLYVLILLSRCYADDKRLIRIVAISFAFSGGILSAITFIRMYVMAMFWVMLLTYFFVRELKDLECGRGFLLKVFVVTVCGAMTHYYCIVYVALISVVYGTYLLFKQQYRNMLYFVCTMVAAGYVSYLIFPAMLTHIFLGPRGLEVMGNAANLSDFFTRFLSFSCIIIRQLFGYVGALLLLVLAVISRKRTYNPRNEDSQTDTTVFLNIMNQNLKMPYALLVIPTILYFIIVTKITVYRLDRYMFPIYGNIILISCLLIFCFFQQLSVSKTYKLYLAYLIMCIITISSWFTIGWPYLYLNSKPFLESVAKYSNVDNICLYSEAWRICPMFVETTTYKSIQFCRFDNGHAKQEIVKRIEDSRWDRFVITIISDKPQDNEACVTEFLKKLKTPQHYKKLGSFWWGTSYIITSVKV